MCLPARAASCLPTGVEPVVTLRMTGGDEVVGDFCRIAIDQAHGASGHARIGKGADQSRRAGGVSSGALTRWSSLRPGRGELAHHLVDGEVPGVKAATRGPPGSDDHLLGLRLREGTMRPYTRWDLVGKPFDDSAADMVSTLASARGLPCSCNYDGGY